MVMYYITITFTLNEHVAKAMNILPHLNFNVGTFENDRNAFYTALIVATTRPLK